MNASALIDQLIEAHPDWRGASIARLRRLVREADPEIQEEWKWGTAVWVHGGMVCAVGAFAMHVKLNFFQGAALPDPHGLFNAGLDAKKMRAIDFHDGDPVDEAALVALIRAAVEYAKM